MAPGSHEDAGCTNKLLFSLSLVNSSHTFVFLQGEQSCPLKRYIFNYQCFHCKALRSFLSKANAPLKPVHQLECRVNRCWPAWTQAVLASPTNKKTWLVIILLVSCGQTLVLGRDCSSVRERLPCRQELQSSSARSDWEISTPRLLESCDRSLLTILNWGNKSLTWIIVIDASYVLLACSSVP